MGRRTLAYPFNLVLEVELQAIVAEGAEASIRREGNAPLLNTGPISLDDFMNISGRDRLGMLFYDWVTLGRGRSVLPNGRFTVMSAQEWDDFAFEWGDEWGVTSGP